MIQFIYTGKLSSTALASLTGKCFLVCNSHCWPQQACLKRRAATLAIFSQFESQKLLPWLSSSFTKVSMLCKFWALTRIYILYVKMKNFGFRKNICHRLKPHYCFAQSFNLSLVSEYKQNIRTKPQVQNQILCRTADLNWQPVQQYKKWVSAQIYLKRTATSDGSHQAVCQNLQMISGMNYIWLQPKLESNVRKALTCKLQLPNCSVAVDMGLNPIGFWSSSAANGTVTGPFCMAISVVWHLDS